MNRLKRVIAAVLITVFVYGILGSSISGVFAAETPVSIIVDNYENGTLSFHWIHQLTGAKAAVVSYHKPNADDTATLTTSEAILVGNAATVSGLEADYVYDISVAIYGAVDENNDPTGNPIGRGLLFYLPLITFYSTATDQAYEDIPGGGREIGGYPKLKLSWKVPRSFYDPENVVYPDTDSNTANNVFIPANEANALSYMQSSLNRIYNDNREISTLNYRINVSTELNLLNSGSAQAALLVDQQSGDAYTAKVSGDTVNSAEITTPDALNFVSFELWGRADETSEVPTSSSTQVLPDNDILPGTVYYMNIKPIFKNNAGTNVTAVTVGNPTDLNGSLLSGERSYTSTPVRFQITKDSANNIYVKIYKINQGSLDLPRLYYEVQATDDPSIQGDWTVKKTLDDSYFSGTTAVTVINGVNPSNEVFYKIVVKSDSPGDRLESSPMPYILTVDTSKPPLPTGIAVVDRVLSTAQVTPPAGVQITVKSTDVTLSWDKPLNWSTIKSDLYFHFLLNTNQTEIASDVPLYVNNTYWDSYPAKYRLVKYVSAESGNIKEVGNRLTYTINAFDLFKWEDGTGSIVGNNIPNMEAYPTFLIPNTVYYLQMYTTTTANRGTVNPNEMSDRSIVSSFTTLNGVELDVPLPMNITLDANSKDTSVIPAVNYLDLKFDKVTNLDWNNYTDEYDQTLYSYETYYDIYMNSRTDTPFTLVGTTEDLHGDVGFTGADDLQSTSIKARISQFTAGSSVQLFGSHILPNTTYYFKLKTRLVVRRKVDAVVISAKESIDTAILPVTTIVLVVTPPDDSQRKPLAPTDFDIAVDSSQNQLLSGSSVTFTWKVLEDDVIYQMIRTTQKVGPTDPSSTFSQDPEYLSFLQEYDTISDGVENNKVYLDPVPNLAHPTHPGKFTYDSATKICTYTVDRRLFPNKLYYFSLKAVRVDVTRVPLTSDAESTWVSIPVTTSLIEAPASLEVVLNAELGFYWTDATAGLTAEDYKIYAKGPSDADYKLMTRSQATIVKDKDGSTYYGRITGLKLDTYYDVRVTKGVNTPVYDKSGLKTKDGYHEIEVKWIGKSADSYSGYDIALMAEDGTEYTILSVSDLEQYVDKDGAILPYYTEETALTVGSETLYYHARIKSAEIVLAGGITTRQPLRSNVKYYIKVRAVKIDPTETDFIAYSKYIGPVNTRTEFNQDDYDNTDREEQQEAIFLDRMEALEKGYFWRVAIGNNSASTILLKGDRVADAIKNSSGDTFTIDMTAISVNISKDEIYVPVSVIKVMNLMNRSLVIRTSGAELLLRPTTLDASANEQMREILARQEVKDLYIKMVIARSTTASIAIPSNSSRVSDINELDIQALGLAKSDNDLKLLFHDKLYNKDNGLVNEKLNMLQNTYVGSGTDSSRLIDQYTQSLVELIEIELSAYIESTLQSVKLSYTARDIQTLGAPASVNLSFNGGNGVKLPYVLYDGTASWQKITTNTVLENSSVRFNLLKTGKYVILTAQSNISDVPAGYWAKGYITRLTSKYDLEEVFQGINNSFMPENIATCKEVMLLYEKVTGRTAENTGLDIRQKNAVLGLDGIINANSLMKSVKRQETAAVLLKLFSIKKGVSMSGLKPGGRVIITDEDNIGDVYFNSVLMMVDMKVMSLDDSSKFYPGDQMTRAEVVAAFVRLLEMTGEL